MTFARDIADRMVFMDAGAVLQDGMRREVLGQCATRYVFEERIYA